MKRRNNARHSLWTIFRMPLLLGLLSILGLISALVGDGAWDAVSWFMLGIPILVTAWAIRPPHRVKARRAVGVSPISTSVE